MISFTIFIDHARHARHVRHVRHVRHAKYARVSDDDKFTDLMDAEVIKSVLAYRGLGF
jgi:hypothetical protein